MQADDLTIYWASDRGGDLDLYDATRASVADAYGSVMPITAIDGTGGQSSPYLTADELTMYYIVIPAAATNGDLYVATRASTSAAFGAGTLRSPISTAPTTTAIPW